MGSTDPGACPVTWFSAFTGTCLIALNFAAGVGAWLDPELPGSPCSGSVGRSRGSGVPAQPAGFACLAPHALGSSWSFLGPTIHLPEPAHLLQT